MLWYVIFFQLNLQLRPVMVDFNFRFDCQWGMPVMPYAAMKSIQLGLMTIMMFSWIYWLHHDVPGNVTSRKSSVHVTNFFWCNVTGITDYYFQQIWQLPVVTGVRSTSINCVLTPRQVTDFRRRIQYNIRQAVQESFLLLAFQIIWNVGICWPFPWTRSSC